MLNFRVSWSANHEQYWQGHGIACSAFTHCATGCGETLRDAFQDALENLAQQDIDIDTETEQAMLAALTEQVKEPDMLDWSIVREYCPASGNHTLTCTACDGIGCAGTGTILDDEPDCAICAGDWHYYVSVDVQI